jgi:hypothetical protein
MLGEWQVGVLAHSRGDGVLYDSIEGTCRIKTSRVVEDVIRRYEIQAARTGTRPEALCVVAGCMSTKAARVLEGEFHKAGYGQIKATGYSDIVTIDSDLDLSHPNQAAIVDKVRMGERVIAEQGGKGVKYTQPRRARMIGAAGVVMTILGVLIPGSLHAAEGPMTPEQQREADEWHRIQLMDPAAHMPMP